MESAQGLHDDPLSLDASSRVSQAVAGVEISLPLWLMAFHSVGLPHLGSIYPDRSPKEEFSGWLTYHCHPSAFAFLVVTSI